MDAKWKEKEKDDQNKKSIARRQLKLEQEMGQTDHNQGSVAQVIRHEWKPRARKRSISLDDHQMEEILRAARIEAGELADRKRVGGRVDMLSENYKNFHKDGAQVTMVHYSTIGGGSKDGGVRVQDSDGSSSRPPSGLSRIPVDRLWRDPKLRKANQETVPHLPFADDTMCIHM